MATSIQLNTETKNKLEKMKIHHRESYDDVVNRLINTDEDDFDYLSPNTIKNIQKAMDDLAKGKKFISHEQVKKELGL